MHGLVVDGLASGSSGASGSFPAYIPDARYRFSIGVLEKPPSRQPMWQL